MTKQDKEQLNLEINHVFESGANHERIFNMVEMFIDRRYQALATPVNRVMMPLEELNDFCNRSEDFYNDEEYTSDANNFYNAALKDVKYWAKKEFEGN